MDSKERFVEFERKIHQYISSINFVNTEAMKLILPSNLIQKFAFLPFLYFLKRLIDWKFIANHEKRNRTKNKLSNPKTNTTIFFWIFSFLKFHPLFTLFSFFIETGNKLRSFLQFCLSLQEIFAFFLKFFLWSFFCWNTFYIILIVCNFSWYRWGIYLGA